VIPLLMMSTDDSLPTDQKAAARAVWPIIGTRHATRSARTATRRSGRGCRTGRDRGLGWRRPRPRRLPCRRSEATAGTSFAPGGAGRSSPARFSPAGAVFVEVFPQRRGVVAPLFVRSSSTSTSVRRTVSETFWFLCWTSLLTTTSSLTRASLETTASWPFCSTSMVRS